jgi:hypothetical protein
VVLFTLFSEACLERLIVALKILLRWGVSYVTYSACDSCVAGRWENVEDMLQLSDDPGSCHAIPALTPDANARNHHKTDPTWAKISNLYAK